MSAVAPKETEFSRVYSTLPSVLIQHPTKGHAYYIPDNCLSEYKATPKEMINIGSQTVTFLIPGEELIDEVPPYNQDPTDSPDILIRFPATRSAYLIPNEALLTFKIDQPEYSFGDHYVSFIVPGGMELIEEIPLLKKGMLQSNTG